MRITTFVISILLFVNSVCAAQFQITRLDDPNSAAITMSGEINTGDSVILRRTIREANQEKRNVLFLRLNSTGGNLQEAALIANIVIGAGIATFVPNYSTCASACFVVFIAGDAGKYAGQAAKVGVHRVKETATGKDLLQDSRDMGETYRKFGVPGTIIRKMLATPPTELTWLTNDDLRSIPGVKITNSVWPETTHAPGAVATILPEDHSAAPRPSEPDADPEEPASRHTLSEPSQALPKYHAGNKPEWRDVVRTFLDTSASQNHGKPAVSNECQNGKCIAAVMLTTPNGTTILRTVRAGEDRRIIAREICTFPGQFLPRLSMRVCTDYETNRTYQEQYVGNGMWRSI